MPVVASLARLCTYRDRPINNQHTPSAGQAYSQRLGVLSAHQFQATLARFSLGDFLGAAPITGGLFGQNVFVTSTQGEYVLRGTPHYPWQFPKEQFGAALLHAHTEVPVAHPYLYDPTTDIFGWPYLLMPRLQGTSPLAADLTAPQRLAIAQVLGHNLAALHGLAWPFAGEYDLATQTIEPFPGGFAQWLVADIHSWLDQARSHGTATTPGDVAWIEDVIAAAESALAVDFKPCFVMNDYNPGNLLVTQVQGTWQVTGLFDLMEYYFGDGEADLMRLTAIYLDKDPEHGAQLAQAFGTTYLACRLPRPGFAERFALYMLRDRLIVWEYGTRPTVGWFAADLTFRDYATRYTAAWCLFASAIT